jgi:hypothetical protein
MSHLRFLSAILLSAAATVAAASAEDLPVGAKAGLGAAGAAAAAILATGVHSEESTTGTLQTLSSSVGPTGLSRGGNSGPLTLGGVPTGLSPSGNSGPLAPGGAAGVSGAQSNSANGSDSDFQVFSNNPVTLPSVVCTAIATVATGASGTSSTNTGH